MADKPARWTDPPLSWAKFKRHSGLVLGFHGCDSATAARVLNDPEQHLQASRNDYDWLGEGIYFWEFDPWRALEFAREATEKRHLTKGVINVPSVVGAVIDLGHCCNLLERSALAEVARAHAMLVAFHEFTGEDMPQNRGPERGARFLDRAVIDLMHDLRSRRRLQPYDTVRAAFIEGSPVYPAAGFHAKNHIQIAVRDPACIRGYFRLPGL